MKSDFELAPPLQQIDRTYVLYRGQKLSYFGGCDYFRLSSHPRILASIRAGIERYGLSVSASRVTTGNHPLYEKLEQRMAEFFHFPAAAFLPSGYIANLAVAEALAGEIEAVYIDEKAHPSLQTAAKMLGCRVVPFPHRKLKRVAGQRILIATEGMFGQDGALAPLRYYLKLLPKAGRLWIDEAHGAGTRELLNLPSGRVIQTVTFSKAFGVYGGAVLGPASVVRKVMSTPIFAGQTPLPLPLANACLTAMDLLNHGSPLRKRLHENLSGFGSPIIQIAPGSPALKAQLLRKKIYPSWIRYPGGPPKGYFRFAISSEHTKEQLRNLASVIALKK